MASICKGKSSWPELVGAKGVNAAETIERENPYVNAQIVPKGSPFTGDLRCNRVRVAVNSGGFVVNVPTIG